MQNILKSASKLAFLALIATAAITFSWSVFTGKAEMKNEDFMVLAVGAASFYFANKGNPEEDYLGK